MDYDHEGYTEYEYDNEILQTAEVVISVVLFIGFGILCLIIGWICGFGTKPCIKQVTKIVNRKIDQRKEGKSNYINHAI